MKFHLVRLVSPFSHFQMKLWFSIFGGLMLSILSLVSSAIGLESRDLPSDAIEFVGFLDTGKLVFAPKEKILIFVETSPSEKGMSYRWRSSIGSDPVPVEGNPSKAYWEAPELEGVYKITVTAFDKNRDIQRSHFFNVRISLDGKSVFKPEPSIAQK